jgi:hypothetical protein
MAVICRRNPIRLIRRIPHTALDRSRYDACIAAAANGMPYAFSWYLSEMAGKWEALVEGDY